MPSAIVPLARALIVAVSDRSESGFGAPSKGACATLIEPLLDGQVISTSIVGELAVAETTVAVHFDWLDCP
jgi:hypothetical protein